MHPQPCSFRRGTAPALRRLSAAVALLAGGLLSALQPAQAATAANPVAGASRVYSVQHAATGGFLAEIVSFDSASRTLWVSGVSGVDVLDAATGALLQRIDTRAWGSVNSVAVKHGLAAIAVENTDRTQAGTVLLFDTATRSLASGVNQIAVGALPDMLTFTPDGSRLLVANEGTPATYGARLADSDGHRNYAAALNDPAGSVSIIDMGSRSVVATAGLAGVATSGSHLRTNTGMDFEPEYIAVNAAGTRAWVTLQEANGVGVLNLQTGQFEQVVGLGAKDFSLAGNRIDPLNNGSIQFQSVAAKGLYMPDGIAAYEAGGQTFIVMANEGDFREDDGDRSAASSLGAAAPLNALRISNTDSSAGDLYAAGARSFSIRDAAGNLVYDSGETLDVEAALRGIYDDGRSRDKGVEPESVELLSVGGRTLAFVGLERTLKSAVAVFDITDPTQVSFLDMLVSDGDLSPEGLKAFTMDGHLYLAFSNEVSNSTALWQLAAAPVPEPGSAALLLAGGLGLAAWVRRRGRSA